MALRVLLADESSTIKKVMQLALQDFAVEVKSVPVGIDVLAVTKTFKPDIIFADVLLTKRSGYEVCSDIKKDSDTLNVPVVLMWSGFMELDEAKASDCKADRRLEKPFDADTLRGIVKDLVQKTKKNPLSEYLTFPNMPDFAETRDHSNAEPIGDIYAIPESNEFDTLQEEEFAQVPLTTTPKHDDSYQDDGDWAHRDLSQISHAHIKTSGDFEEISFSELDPVVNNSGTKTNPNIQIPVESSRAALPKAENVAPKAQEAVVKSQTQMNLSPDMIEKIIREQARETIESICWKVIPDIAERVVREEIQKILRDADK